MMNSKEEKKRWLSQVKSKMRNPASEIFLPVEQWGDRYPSGLKAKPMTLQ